MTAKTSNKLDELEQRIGHTFRDRRELERALRHSSVANGNGSAGSYERLEFLGDRVLGLCIAQRLYATFPDAPEGELSVRLNALVSGAACAEIADEIGLSDFIETGSDVKQVKGKRMRSVRADVVESLIAAIYLDAGLEAAETFVLRYWTARLHDAAGAEQDSKTALQEWSHTTTGATPVYEVVERSGPDHDPTFVVAVNIDGAEGARGEGRSKRIAEQAAARAVLVREGVWANAEGAA